MTRFEKIYQEHKRRKELNKEKIKDINVEGYGYIKRRLGLLSNELKGPTYCELPRYK